MADSLLGYGITLSYSAAGSPTGTASSPLGTVMEITPPKYTVEEVETTLLNSTMKTYSPGLPDFEAGFKLRLDLGDAGVNAMRAAISQAPVPIFNWQMKYQDGSTETFAGFPKSWEPDTYSPGQTRTASISLRLNSASSFNPAPPS